MTGDEPHYLVMSQGFLQSGALEQTQPYIYEFKNRVITPSGLETPGTIPDMSNSYTFLGPNGLFNYHNLGLPALLMLPFLLGGVAGAKIAMVLFSSLIVLLAWHLSGLFSRTASVRIMATLACTLSSTLIPSANQIYPDLLGGTLSFTGF